MHPEFLDEDIMTLFEDEVDDEDKDKWIVWFDGVSNALGHGVGWCSSLLKINVSPSWLDCALTARIIWPSMRRAALESK